MNETIKPCPTCGGSHIGLPFMQPSPQPEPAKCPAKGEWRVRKPLKYNDGDYGVVIVSDEGAPATAWGKTPEEAQATAAQIVEAVNGRKGEQYFIDRCEEMRAELLKTQLERDRIREENDQLAREIQQLKRELDIERQ